MLPLYEIPNPIIYRDDFSARQLICGQWIYKFMFSHIQKSVKNNRTVQPDAFNPDGACYVVHAYYTTAFSSWFYMALTVSQYPEVKAAQFLSGCVSLGLWFLSIDFAAIKCLSWHGTLTFFLCDIIFEVVSPCFVQLNPTIAIMSIMLSMLFNLRAVYCYVSPVAPDDLGDSI